MTDVDTPVSVTLTGPAKIGGKRVLSGKTVTVSSAMALQLAQGGAATFPASVTDLGGDILLGSDFDQAVQAELMEREILWAKAMDHFETMAEDRQAAATDALNEEIRRLTSEVDRLGATLAEREARIAELEAQLVAAANDTADKNTKRTAKKTAADPS